MALMSVLLIFLVSLTVPAEESVGVEELSVCGG